MVWSDSMWKSWLRVAIGIIKTRSELLERSNLYKITIQQVVTQKLTCGTAGSNEFACRAGYFASERLYVPAGVLAALLDEPRCEINS